MTDVSELLSPEIKSKLIDEQITEWAAASYRLDIQREAVANTGSETEEFDKQISVLNSAISGAIEKLNKLKEG